MSCHDHGAVDRESALDVLLAHRSDFVAFVSSRVEAAAVAEDLVQESLARAYERIGDLRVGEAVLGWFYQILRNAVIDHHRRRSASARTLDRLAVEPLPVDDVAPPGRVCTCVSHLVTTLKPEYAEALTRVDVEGQPVKDLAGELGITANNAGVRVFRARDALRKKVMATCRKCAEAGCTDCTCTSATSE